jgi:hypothetical protein
MLCFELRMTECREEGFVLSDLLQCEVCDGLMVQSNDRAEKRHSATKTGEGREWRLTRGLLIWRREEETTLGGGESETERRKKM